MNEQPLDSVPISVSPHPHRSTISSTFRFAMAGVTYLIRTQRNARIHAGAAVIACVLATWLGLNHLEWAILALTITNVVVLEGVNTAVEAVVDLASPEIHPLAKIAKDVSAAMVLIAAVASVVVGILLFGPPILHHLHR